MLCLGAAWSGCTQPSREILSLWKSWPTGWGTLTRPEASWPASWARPKAGWPFRGALPGERRPAGWPTWLCISRVLQAGRGPCQARSRPAGREGTERPKAGWLAGPGSPARADPSWLPCQKWQPGWSALRLRAQAGLRPGLRPARVALPGPTPPCRLGGTCQGPGWVVQPGQKHPSRPGRPGQANRQPTRGTYQEKSRPETLPGP